MKECIDSGMGSVYGNPQGQCSALGLVAWATGLHPLSSGGKGRRVY